MWLPLEYAVGVWSPSYALQCHFNIHEESLMWIYTSGATLQWVDLSFPKEIKDCSYLLSYRNISSSG
ncbi:unnamed protein product [Caretta caretta]